MSASWHTNGLRATPEYVRLRRPAELAGRHYFANAEIGEANRFFVRAKIVQIEDGAVDAPLGTHEVAGVFAAPQVEAAFVDKDTGEIRANNDEYEIENVTYR